MRRLQGNASKSSKAVPERALESFFCRVKKKLVLSSFWRIQRRGAGGLEFQWIKAFAFVEGVDTDAVRREQGLQGLVGGTG